MVADGESGSGGFHGASAAFDAALDVLGDWGSDGDWLSRLPTPPASPPASLGTKPCDGRTNYRRKCDARDAKRAALEAEVAQLSHALGVEKKRFPGRSPPLTGDALALGREWAKIAQRQKRQRYAAENAHAELLEAYNAQVKTAQQIDRVLLKARTIGQCLAPTSETVMMTNYCGPTLDVATHMAYLDILHGHANAVLSSGLYNEHACPDSRDVRVREIGSGGIQVQFVAEWVLPFSVENVANAVWNEITRMEHEGRQIAYEHAVANHCVLVSSFVSSPATAEVSGSNHGQVVEGITHGQTALRRFEPSAADGSVWLLAMNHGRILSKDGKTTKGFMQGDGWIVVEPAETKRCRIKWCHRVSGRLRSLETASLDERARWSYAAVTRPMRSQWERDFERTCQAVENALVLTAASKATRPQNHGGHQPA